MNRQAAQPLDDATIEVRSSQPLDDATVEVRSSQPPVDATEVQSSPSLDEAALEVQPSQHEHDLAANMVLVGIQYHEDSADSNVVEGTEPQLPQPCAGSHGITSLEDAFKWNDRMVDELLGDDDDALHTLLQRWSSSTWSSACSGVDAPHAALVDIHASLRKHCARTRQDVRLQDPPKCLYSIEWDSACQGELLKTHDGCVFGDLASFFTNDVQEHLPTLFDDPGKALDALGPVVKQGKGIKSHAWCFRHNRVCHCRETDRHVAGTPCTAFSAQGARKKEADVTIIYFLAWVGLRLLLQDCIVLFENVPGLLPLIVEFLSQTYFVDPAEDMSPMTPSAFGWAITRPREYYVLRHRQKAVPLVSPLSRFTRRFHAACRWSRHEFFWLHKFDGEDEACAIRDELDKELRWAQKCDTCPNRVFAPLPHRCKNAFLLALNQMEADFLQGYIAKRDFPARAVQLNQDPYSHPMMSRDDLMHCLIKNMTIVMAGSPVLEVPRWLSGSEALACQGFRTHPSTRHELRQSPFEIPDDTRKVYKLRMFAGNSMHVQCVGICPMHSFLNTGPKVKRETPDIQIQSSFFNAVSALAARHRVISP